MMAPQIRDANIEYSGLLENWTKRGHVDTGDTCDTLRPMSIFVALMRTPHKPAVLASDASTTRSHAGGR